MHRNRRNRLLTLALLAVAAAACEEATGPEEGLSFDAEAALQDYQAMEEILASDAMAGFRAMAGGVSLETLGPVPIMAMRAAAELAAPSSAEDTRAFAARLAGIVSSSPGEPAKNPIISPFNRGKTFAYDPALGRYAHDPSRTDGPPNGVRLILYEDDGTGHPDPGREIGYVDLLDQGDNSAEDISLALAVVVGGEARLEYSTTVDVVDRGGKITVDGFIRGENPADRLDFDLGVEGSGGGGRSSMDIDFEMRVDSRDFRIDGSVAGVSQGTGENGEIDLTVKHGAESIRIEATGTETLLDGTFHLNGEVFARVFGDPESPTFEGATGEPLTWAEALVLRHMVDIAEDVFDLFEDLLDPVDELVILALIL